MNKKRPYSRDTDNNIKSLGIWLLGQNQNYKNNKDIMKNKDIKKKWKDIKNDDKYKEYLLTNEEEWEYNLEKVKKYIDVNKIRPSSKNKNIHIKKIGAWLITQKKNYEKNQYIMLNEYIRKQWKDFIEDKEYNKYFNTTITNNESSLESDNSDNEEEIEEPVKKNVKKSVPKAPTKKTKK
jgi:hypothetical protein